MKKVLLIGINARYTHSNPAIHYIKRFCFEYESNLNIKEYTINSDQENVLTEISEIKPFAIAFSIYIWNSLFIQDLIEKIKVKLPSIKIIAGGPEPSYNSEKWKTLVDYIIIGAGESGFKYLLEQNFNTDKIINIQNPPFSEIPFPYTENEMTSMKNKYFYYESSRGCPYSCSYCLSSRSDQKLQFKDIETVKTELFSILNHNPKLVKFIDRTFNSKKDHYLSIWKFLIDNKLKTKSTTKFHFEIFPALLSDSDFEILQNAPENLFQFEIGIQSTNEKTLTSINRNEQWETVKSNISKLLKLKNIHIHVDLIVGLPFEDLSLLEKSFNDIYSLDADHFQMGFLKVLPGTELFGLKEKYKISHKDEPPYEILKNKWLNQNNISNLKLIESLLEIFYNSGKFKTTISEYCYLFDQPFQAYNKLAEFQKDNKVILEKSSWEDQASLMFDFIKNSFPDKKLYFLDCLRFDWCNFSKSHHYPNLLKSYFTRELKRECFIFIVKNSEKSEVTFKDKKFSQETLRKSIFFEPETDEFKLKFKKKEKIIMFLPSKDTINFNLF